MWSAPGALTVAALATALIACRAPAPPPAAPPPPGPAAPVPEPDPDADLPDPAARELAVRACTGYDRCQELGRAWREGRPPEQDGADQDAVSEDCLATARRLSADDLEALRTCLDQDCHGGCDCLDWVARWGSSVDLECNYGDNPSDFVDPDGDR